MASAVRATELPNPFTADIDVAELPAMVRLFGVSDALLFTGYGGYPGLNSDESVAAVVAVARAVAAALRHPRGRIVFSGCGTSGRLSHCMARAMNGWLARGFGVGKEQHRFDYLLAGSDAALLLPQESVEDKPDAGVNDLQAWEAKYGVSPDDPVVVIGISCGLSATYVGSMLHASMQRPGYTSVALGFNPVDAVKAVAVDGWGMTFHSVLQSMLTGPAAQRCVVLNPVLGPETIAGSSRMKGGSATKIVLETLCSLGAMLVHGSLPAAVPPPLLTSSSQQNSSGEYDDATLAAYVRDCYLQYEITVRHVYSQPSATGGMVSLIQQAASSLNSAVSTDDQLGGYPVQSVASPGETLLPGRRFVSPTGRGRVLYVGVGTAGILGLIDASECTPTYGSLFNDVRGFIAGGWATMGNKQGHVALPMPPHLRGDGGAPSADVREEIALDLDSFIADFGPTLTSADCVVLLFIHEGGDVSAQLAQLAEATQALQLAKNAGATTAHAIILPASAPSPDLTSALSPITTLAPTGVVLRLPSVTLTHDLRASLPVTSAADAHEAQERFSAPAPSFLGELALKLVLNATTTGAHIRTGTIYTNRMVKVMMTNAKLYHRAVGIVSDVTGVGRHDAERCVLRAIYKKNEEADEGDITTLQTTVPVSAHVSAAATQKGLVPLAIMLALDVQARAKRRGQQSGGGEGKAALTISDAQELLRVQPIVRKAIAKALQG